MSNFQAVTPEGAPVSHVQQTEAPPAQPDLIEQLYVELGDKVPPALEQFVGQTLAKFAWKSRAANGASGQLDVMLEKATRSARTGAQQLTLDFRCTPKSGSAVSVFFGSSRKRRDLGCLAKRSATERHLALRAARPWVLLRAARLVFGGAGCALRRRGRDPSTVEAAGNRSFASSKTALGSIASSHLVASEPLRRTSERCTGRVSATRSRKRRKTVVRSCFVYSSLFSTRSRCPRSVCTLWGSPLALSTSRIILATVMTLSISLP